MIISGETECIGGKSSSCRKSRARAGGLPSDVTGIRPKLRWVTGLEEQSRGGPRPGRICPGGTCYPEVPYVDSTLMVHPPAWEKTGGGRGLGSV